MSLLLAMGRAVTGRQGPRRSNRTGSAMRQRAAVEHHAGPVGRVHIIEHFPRWYDIFAS